MTGKEKDILKAQKIAEIKAKEIMIEMDICDSDNPNYAIYQYNLKFNIYVAIKSSLKL